MSTGGTATPPTLSSIAEDVGALETQFKTDLSSLSASTVNLLHEALTAAENEGSIVASALKTAVATVKK